MEDVIQKFCDLAKQKYARQIGKMILFGSFARGEKNKDSDIDLLIVWRGNKRKGWNSLEKIAFPLILESEKYLSLKILGWREFKKMEKMGNPFIQNIKKEGIDFA